MKRIDIFCASQASTDICMSMDQPSSSSLPPIIPLAGRAIDRHNPIIRDQKRTPRALTLAPCTSQSPPINPQPYHLLHKTKKEPPAAAINKTDNDQTKSKNPRKPIDRKDKKGSSTAAGDGIAHKKDSSSSSVGKEGGIIRKGGAKRGDFITPLGSSRYLLSEKDFLDGLSDPKELNGQSAQANSKRQDSISKPSSTSNSERPSNQVRFTFIRDLLLVQDENIKILYEKIMIRIKIGTAGSSFESVTALQRL